MWKYTCYLHTNKSSFHKPTARKYTLNFLLTQENQQFKTKPKICWFLTLKIVFKCFKISFWFISKLSVSTETNFDFFVYMNRNNFQNSVWNYQNCSHCSATIFLQINYWETPQLQNSNNCHPKSACVKGTNTSQSTVHIGFK